MSPIKIIFFGTPEFASIGLAELYQDPRFEIKLVVTQPDRPAGRGGKIQEPPVKQLAVKHSTKVFQPQNLRKELEVSLASINQEGPYDIGVVIAFGQILPEAILNIPTHGCVNVHGSLLPRWRGAAPIQRAILAGDRQTGICLMKMDIGLDTGAVYSRAEIPISETDTFLSLHDSLAHLGAKLLARDLAKIASGEIKAVAQSSDGITYAKKISVEESKLDWKKSAIELSLQVRGLYPFPGAFCFLKGKRLKVFQSKALDASSDVLECGKVHFIDKSTLEIKCGQGVLSLLEVQLEGKKRMPIAEFLKGMPLDSSFYLE